MEIVQVLNFMTNKGGTILKTFVTAEIIHIILCTKYSMPISHFYIYEEIHLMLFSGLQYVIGQWFNKKQALAAFTPKLLLKGGFTQYYCHVYTQPIQMTIQMTVLP